MNSISISQLKTNPSKAISESLEFPLAVLNRNNVEAYLIGKELYDVIVSHIEDVIDHNAVKNTNFKKGRDFEDVAKELGL